MFVRPFTCFSNPSVYEIISSFVTCIFRYLIIQVFVYLPSVVYAVISLIIYEHAYESRL